MALVGVALTVYRWPWVETKTLLDPFDTEMQEATTYRRGWNGKPLKHGLRIGIVAGHSGYRDEEYFVDDELRWDATYNAHQKIIQKKHHAGGKLNGPCLEWGGRLTGQYRNDFKVGLWTQRQGDHVLEQNFDQSLLHGESRWLTNGKVTQTATFDKGRLSTWNGRPLREEFLRWLEENHVDAISRDVLMTRLEHVDFDGWCNASDNALEWPLFTSDHRLLLHFGSLEHGESFTEALWRRLRNFRYRDRRRMSERIETVFYHNDPATPIGELFVEQALVQGRVVEFRFGIMSLVAYEKAERPGVDPTGISHIRFAPGSPEETAWLEPFVEPSDLHTDQEWRFQEIFASTPIQIDAEEFRPALWRYTSPSGRDLPTQCRPRRDVLGLILYAQGWSCRQRGNVLEILPWSAE